MKLIIDIPKEKYNQIVNSYQGSKVRPKDYEIAIINGVPLEKIRAEIVDLGQRTMNDNRASGIWTCRDIIDKYRTESEE